jgi:hypothetical protein
VEGLHIKVIETGELRADNVEVIDRLVEWLRQEPQHDGPIGAVQAVEDSDIIKKYWKGFTPSGKRFVFFGNDNAFEQFQRRQLT